MCIYLSEKSLSKVLANYQKTKILIYNSISHNDIHLLPEGFPLSQMKLPLCITMPTSPLDSSEVLLPSIHAHSSCRLVVTTRIDTVCRWYVPYRTELTRAKLTPGAWNNIFDISVAQAFPTTNSPIIRLSSPSMTGKSICFPKQF